MQYQLTRKQYQSNQSTIHRLVDGVVRKERVMGTNIYARINPPKAEREKFVLKVKAIVDSDELFMFSKLNDLLQEYKEEYPEVHLGKRSC